MRRSAIPKTRPRWWPRRFRGTDGLDELRARAGRLAHDVPLRMAPVRGHLPAPGAGIILCSNCREQRFQRGYSKHEAKCPIAVIRINPIDTRAKKKPHEGSNGFMPGAGDLKEDFALPLQLD